MRLMTIPLLGVALALALTASQANALTVTMNLDDDLPPEGQADFADETLDNGDSAIAGPFSITFTNVVTSDGLPGAQVDSDGIFFGVDPFDFAVVSMDLVFGIDTVILSYDIDYVFLEDPTNTAAFMLSGVNGDSGWNDFDAISDFGFDMGTIPVFLAGETYSLTHNVSGIDVSQIDELVLWSQVPLPGTGLSLLCALVGGAALSRRRRT